MAGIPNFTGNANGFPPLVLQNIGQEQDPTQTDLRAIIQWAQGLSTNAPAASDVLTATPDSTGRLRAGWKPGSGNPFNITSVTIAIGDLAGSYPMTGFTSGTGSTTGFAIGGNFGYLGIGSFSGGVLAANYGILFNEDGFFAVDSGTCRSVWQFTFSPPSGAFSSFWELQAISAEGPAATGPGKYLGYSNGFPSAAGQSVGDFYIDPTNKKTWGWDGTTWQSW